MITSEKITEKHPELLELREFKTHKKIIAAFKNGGTMWEVRIWFSKPNHIEEMKILKIKKNRGNEVVIVEVPNFPNEEHFISDMQNHPAKAVFTSKERAEKFFEAAKKAFAEDKEWQTQSDFEFEKDKQLWKGFDNLIY